MSLWEYKNPWFYIEFESWVFFIGECQTSEIHLNGETIYLYICPSKKQKEDSCIDLDYSNSLKIFI